MTYETYCKSKALYWFCRMDWGLTFISPSPLTDSSSVYPQQSTCIMRLHSKTINFYFLLRFIMILYHTYGEWTNWCLYLAQKLGSCFHVSSSEAVNFYPLSLRDVSTQERSPWKNAGVLAKWSLPEPCISRTSTILSEFYCKWYFNNVF